MKPKVTLIPGDGIGPEVTDAMRMCIDASGVPIDWDIQMAGAGVIEEYETPLPNHVLESIKENKVAIKGPIETPIGKGFRSVNVQLRQSLDLFAAVRPSKFLEGAPAVSQNVDLIVIRENTEDLYAGIEFAQGEDRTLQLIDDINRNQQRQIRTDSAISIKPISEFGSHRIVKFAFEYALKHGRQKVTAVHKANIMKHSDGLFLDVARQVAKDYQGKVEFEDIIVDNLCMQLVQNPDQFDILALPNLYGDIVSDLCAGLVGGLGVAPGANIGEDIALFEPVHGSAPRFAGQNKVNPTACILSGIMMLRHIDEVEAASRLEWALREVVRAGQDVTFDLKDDHEQHLAVSTTEMAQAVCRLLGS